MIYVKASENVAEDETRQKCGDENFVKKKKNENQERGKN